MTLELTPDELLTTTRSVRQRLDLTRPVEPKLIEECIDIAQQAPSGSNRQHWHWLVLTDPEVRAQVAHFYRKSFDAYAEARPKPEEMYAGDEQRINQQKRVNASANFLSERMADVPVLTIAAIESAGGELPAGNQAGMWGSLLPAAWSYALAARARGLGTAWTTLHLEYEKEIAEVLRLPSGVFTGVLLPTAYYTGDTFKPAKRPPASRIIHHNGW